MKKLMLVAAFVLATGYTIAQTGSQETIVVENKSKYKVETNRFWSNWYISAGIGTQMYFGDRGDRMKLSDRLSPALDIAAGKWITPGIGFRLMYSGWSINHVTGDAKGIGTGSHTDGTPYPYDKGGAGTLYEQKYNFMHFQGDLMFNLSNLFCGYNENRVWSFIPYIGMGWIVTNDAPEGHEVTATLGILNSFRLSNALNLNLDVHASAFSDIFNGELLGKKQDGLGVATIGLTYKFKQRGWKRSTQTFTTIKVGEDELNAMRDKLRLLNNENRKLRDDLAQANNRPIQKVNVLGTIAPNLITFPIGKSTLTNNIRANLGFLAKYIKAGSQDVVYTITGYADRDTGSAALNQRLSKARAEEVYNCLVQEFGVPERLLKINAQGGVENMFYNDPRLSRAVITAAEIEK